MHTNYLKDGSKDHKVKYKSKNRVFKFLSLFNRMLDIINEYISIMKED